MADAHVVAPEEGAQAEEGEEHLLHGDEIHDLGGGVVVAGFAGHDRVVYRQLLVVGGGALHEPVAGIEHLPGLQVGLFLNDLFGIRLLVHGQPAVLRVYQPLVGSADGHHAALGQQAVGGGGNGVAVIDVYAAGAVGVGGGDLHGLLIVEPGGLYVVGIQQDEGEGIVQSADVALRYYSCFDLSHFRILLLLIARWAGCTWCGCSRSCSPRNRSPQAARTRRRRGSARS